MHDVLVVGGGPVGSHVAGKLAKMGHKVLLLERKERLGGRVCCSGIISEACFSSFAADNSLVLRRANSARIFSPSGRLIRLWRPQNQVCIVDRAALDVAMASRARAAGADYFLNSAVKDLEVRDDRVVVEAAQNTRKLNFEARVVVIATGYGSRLVERLELGNSGDFVMGAQAEVEAGDIDEVEVYMGQKVAPGFFAWLVPTSPPRALLGLLTRYSPGLYLRKLLKRLKAQGKIASDEELSYRGISLRPPAKTYARRLLIVGDAAGQVKPTTGGGIYYGLLGAEIAAANLHRALDKDDLSARGLAGYEREWKKELGQELRIGYWARKLYERLSDRQIDRIFDIMINNGIDRALLKADDLSFDGHGRAVLRVIGQGVVSRALAAMKIPFQPGLG